MPRVKQKLEIVRKAWGYVEIVQATMEISGWRVWLIKNYSGPILKRKEISGQGLPGNRAAKEKLEYSGYTPEQAIDHAYRGLGRKGRGVSITRDRVFSLGPE